MPRLVKMAVMLLLGALAWQTLPPEALGTGPVSNAPADTCCGSACGCCKGSACCARPAQPSSSSAPLPASSSSRKDLKALVLPLTATPGLYLPSSGELRFTAPPSPVVAVPIFQRDCSYLI